jgi:RNA polymerase sigma factor (sigma-70 family)
VEDFNRAVDAIWRIESPKVIAGVAHMVHDIGLAEELAQDAFVAALQQWPESGVPERPGAWLMGTAKHHAIDLLRRNQTLQRKHDELGRQLEGGESSMPDLDAAIENGIGDDLLRLMFTACHPVLSADARVALTLRLLGGLTTEEIARAFLTPVATIQQRIVRAKRTLTEARVPFEVPAGSELDARLASVLEAIYLVFNEGYTATAGDDWVRPALCEDALRLGRVLAELVPRAPEVHGLVALIGRGGITSSFGVAWLPLNERNSWAALWGPTRCRRRLRPVTLGRGLRRKRIGCASLRCTTRWLKSRHRRLWS